MSIQVGRAARRKPGVRRVQQKPASIAAKKSVAPLFPGNSVEQQNSSGGAAFIEPERRHAMIAEAAYYRAQQRGFEPGQELADWGAAESEVDDMLLGRGHGT